MFTEGARITDFATAMTGELFALLRGHGILVSMPEADTLLRRGFEAVFGPTVDG